MEVDEDIAGYLARRFDSIQSLSSSRSVLESQKKILQRTQAHYDKVVAQVPHVAQTLASEASDTLARVQAVTAAQTAFLAKLQAHVAAQSQDADAARARMAELAARGRKLRNTEAYLKLALRVNQQVHAVEQLLAVDPAAAAAAAAAPAAGVDASPAQADRTTEPSDADLNAGDASALADTDAGQTRRLLTAVEALAMLRDALSPMRGTVPHLCSYADECVARVFQSCKKRLIQRVDDALKAAAWPAKQTDPALIAGIGLAFRHLGELQLIIDRERVTAPASQLEHTPLIALELMLRPLSRSFSFHFQGNKATNRRDKPEYCYTWLLARMRDHADMLQQHLQPIADVIGVPQLDVRAQFIRALADMMASKLRRDLPGYKGNLPLLAHLLRETLAFDKALRTELQYPLELPGCLDVFASEPVYLAQWLSVEREYTLQQFHQLQQQGDDAWQRVAVGLAADVDDVHATQASTVVLALLSTLTEHFRWLTQAAIQLRFHTDVQLPVLQMLLDRVDGRHAALAMEPAWQLRFNLRNTLAHVDQALDAWNDDDVFVDLQPLAFPDASASSPASSSTGLWDPMRQRLAELIADIEDKMLRLVVRTFTAAAWPYLTKRHVEADAPALVSSIATQDLSRDLSQALSQLRHFLSLLRSCVPRLALMRLWPRVAELLDSLLFRELFQRCDFNHAGARQAQRDMQAVYLVFRPLTQRPERFLPLVSDSVHLLTLPEQEVKRIRSQLAPSDHAGDAYYDDVLAQHGVSVLTAHEAKDVLARRVDVFSN